MKKHNAIKIDMPLLINTHGIFKKQSSFIVNCAYIIIFDRYLMLS